MSNTRLKGFTAGLLTGALLLTLTIAFAQAPLIGLQHVKGLVLDKGTFIELTAGAAVVAGNALYLDSNGKVQKLTSAQTANFVGIADNTAASGSTVRVQISGVATAVCDGNVTINDKVGGTSITPAGTLKTLTSTLAVTSGAGTVTSGAMTGTVTSDAVTGTGTIPADSTPVTSTSASPTVAVTGTLTSTALTGTLTSTATTLTSTAVSGTGIASRTAGRALTACTDTGTFSVLLFPS
jgi:hypothetical protein